MGHPDQSSQVATSTSIAAATGSHRRHRNSKYRSRGRSTSTHRDRRESDDLDRLLESEGEDGYDMIKAVERQDVFHLIHEIRKDIRSIIDTHLAWEELTSVDLNFTIVSPLAIKYSSYRSIAILYCMLLNRIYFQRESTRDLAFQAVNTTRAALCELLAIKLLRTFSNDGLELVTALSASFHPLAGASEEELKELDLTTSYVSLEEIEGQGLPPEQHSSSLELAILSQAKKFIASPLCQRCIDGIWTGKVVLSQIQASHALVNDSYKKRPLRIYDPTKAPLLNHLRLRVPSIRAKLEFCNFMIILFLFVLALAQKGSPTWTVEETLFSIWLFGFAVDELAQLQEHGIAYYLTSLYNVLDFIFCLTSLFWFGLRVSALRHDLPGRSDLSFDCLALGAVLLCPRVATALVQDNVVLLSLKAMLADFIFFTVLAVICFSGFAFAFWSLASESRWTLAEVLWLMLKVWFGASYLGFDEAHSFSDEFGPPLMILYAIFSNTLLLTVLISLLSNTFQIVAMNASEEAMFQFACKTMAGITTDAIFSYQPPLNLIAILIVMPLSYVLSPRWLHKINVFLIRLTSFPILLVIRFFELHSFSNGISLTAEKGKTMLSWMPILNINSSLDGWRGRGSLDVIEAAFEFQPTLDVCDSASSDEDEEGEGANGEATAQGSAAGGSPTRTTSGPKEHALEVPNDKSQRRLSNLSSATSARMRDSDHPSKTQQYGRNYEARSLGSLSSPLAKLFGRGVDLEETETEEPRKPKTRKKSISHPDDGYEMQRSTSGSSSDHETISQTRELMHKIHELEGRSKRIEDLLLKMVEDRTSHTPLL